MINNLKQRARELKRNVVALYFASRDPETPFIAKAFTWVVVAYALSPIDLIPDFIPVIGYLDDLILVPLGIALAIKMIPPEVMKRAQLQATAAEERPQSRVGIVLVIFAWVSILAILVAWLLNRRSF